MSDKSPGNQRRYNSLNILKINRKQRNFFKKIMGFVPQIRQQPWYVSKLGHIVKVLFFVGAKPKKKFIRELSKMAFLSNCNVRQGVSLRGSEESMIADIPARLFAGFLRCLLGSFFDPFPCTSFSDKNCSMYAVLRQFKQHFVTYLECSPFFRQNSSKI